LAKHQHIIGASGSSRDTSIPAGDLGEPIDRALKALIDVEETVDLGPSIHATRDPAHGGASDSRARVAEKPRSYIRKLANLGGMLLALALIWAVVLWFVRLPDEPDRAPWSLLGSGRDEAKASGTQTSVAAASDPRGSDVETRPLGRFDFGPPVLEILRERWHSTVWDRVAAPPPVVEYGSVHDLEAAFNADYVPPPECYHWSSTAQMAACGNHRMRARQAYIESNGRTAQPVDSGSYGSTGTGDWRQGWRDPGTEPEWNRGADPVAAQGGWMRETPLPAEGDWGTEWRREYEEQPSTDWRGDWFMEP
jgi:hypothetical protein